MVLAIGLCMASGVSAQRPCYAKMSPLVREACLVAAGGKEHGAKAFANTGERRIVAFVKVGGDALEALAGCDILARYGGLCIASIPINRLAQLSLRPDVTRIEAGRGTQTLMDTTNIIVGSDALHRGLNLSQPYTGRGVVVGVQDIGFDLTHPTFWSRDMKRYRIKALWDQLSADTVGSRLPAGRDYRDSLSLLTVGHPRDGLMQTHGTHTAGTAAGSGSEGIPIIDNANWTEAAQGVGKLYSGVAPDADLCLVCNATSDDEALISPADTYKYTYALDALGFKYIFDYADSVGKPCVINFSEGSYQDFHGDDLLYYEMLDSLTGPGHIIVASAGNEGQKVTYLHKPQGSSEAEIYATSRWHSKTMSFTTRSDANFKLDWRAADGDLIKTYALGDATSAADSTLRDTLMLGADTLTVTVSAYRDCYGTGLTVADWIITSSSYIYPTSFMMRITGEEADVELYPGTAMLGNDSRITGGANQAPQTNASQNSGIAGEYTHSILSPGSAPSVICVGMTGYRIKFFNYLDSLMDFGGSTGGARNQFSSVGPTFDGRTKPDVMAPGQNIVSALSSFYLENNPNANDRSSDVRHFTYNGRQYAWNSNMGTSMSAPVVTGAIALWLQANPRLTPHDCIRIFAKTCIHYDESLAYPNNLYGYGQIDVEAGLRLVLDEATGIRNIGRNNGDNRIFTLDGRYAGTDPCRLASGIYIVNGKKLLIK